MGDATFQKLHGGVWEADIQDLAVELKVQQEWVCPRVRVVLQRPCAGGTLAKSAVQGGLG